MRSPEEVEQDIVQSAPSQALTEQQEHFLDRLNDLVAKRAHQIATDPKDTFSLRLLARGLYSTYMDCVASGIGDRAADVLEKAQSGSDSVAASKTDVSKAN